MDPDDAECLLKCIPVLQARDTLRLIGIQDFPHLKEEARNKRLRELNNTAFPNILREERAITTNELASLLNRG